MAEAARKRGRTCIGCGAKSDKAQLHRIVRLPDGSIAFDASGRLAGRGTYVCSKECFDAVRGAGKLQRALRTSVESADIERVAIEIETACAVKTS